MEPNVLEIASSSSKDNINNVDTSKDKGKAIQIESDSYDGGSSQMSDSLLDPDSLVYEEDYDYDQYDMLEENDVYSKYQDLFDSKDIPNGVEAPMDWFPETETAKPDESEVIGNSSEIAQPWNALPHNSAGVIPNSAYALPQKGPAFQYYTASQTPDTEMGEASVPVPVPVPVPVQASGYRRIREEPLPPPDPSRAKKNMEDFLGKYLFFKRFDILEDFSDHKYANMGNSSKTHTKQWCKRIQDEWRILENDLPEMIFVRAYESRMDLLRAVIVGAEGTPYHDGLFFFDIYFPETYPSVPPTVHYVSRGLRINPNLYDCGKVCLSLLGTWRGTNPKEHWIANDSTMLQVLVSIQGLILNKDPYFNEPGYERAAGTATGDADSKAYSENTFILSLRTMVYNMRTPPKYFEDFVYGHFFSCAHDVLKACIAYREGALVGCMVKGVVKSVGDEKCNKKFSKDVGTFVDTVLLKEFIHLGVLGLEPEPEGGGDDKASEAKNDVAESSSTVNTRSRSKSESVSSS